MYYIQSYNQGQFQTNITRENHRPNDMITPSSVRTSWKGRVEISFPPAATPITMDSPQPRAEHSNAARITSTLSAPQNPQQRCLQQCTWKI